MNKDEVRKLVESVLKDAVSDTRKRSITASLLTAKIDDQALLLTLIEKLGQRRPETVLGYSEGLDSCPHCRAKYKGIILHGDRPADYCSRCRIAVPKAVRN